LLSFIVLLVFFTTTLAGFYPAIVLSGFNPLAVLKNKISAQGSSGSGVRKVLVVFQFIIAQILIMGTLIMAAQMDYFRHKPLGFDTDAVINVPLPDNAKEKIHSLKTRLESNTCRKERIALARSTHLWHQFYYWPFSFRQRSDGKTHSPDKAC
jgi:hypothetical protein